MLVVIKGAGDIATGIAVRLHNANIEVALTDISMPTAIRRTVCFSQAVIDGETIVEGIRAVLVSDAEHARYVISKGSIPVFIDETAISALRLNPDALVDSILAKKNLCTRISDAPVVLGVGPGFTAGIDCHAVVETQRGHYLGRVLYKGSAAANTGVPGDIGGYTVERIVRATAEGIFRPVRAIGDTVAANEIVAYVDCSNGDSFPVTASICGVLRGLLSAGVRVHVGMKSGDVDPRCEIAHCFCVSDKALAVGGGVLEAIMHFVFNSTNVEASYGK